MKRALSALILLLASTAVLAFQCPGDMEAIDEHLANDPELSSEQLTRVKELREEGEELHEQGQHEHSVEVLAEAKRILGIE